MITAPQLMRPRVKEITGIKVFIISERSWLQVSSLFQSESHCGLWFTMALPS